MTSVKPDLMAAWIRYQHIFKSKTAEVDELEWAMIELADMCRLDAESAWSTILEIIARDSSD
jgi:hypothetical protein